MLIKLRKRMAREESGFTLIELLVVMLILGILAAIAIPAFLSQRTKGQDSDAKAGVRTMETAAETYAVENDGGYVAMSEGALDDIEEAVNDVPNAPASVTPGADTYTVTVASDSGTDFSLARLASGQKVRSCSDPGTGGCGDPTADTAPAGSW